MYALSNSLLEYTGEYRVEMYYMEIFGYDNIDINVDLKIFGEGEHEIYIGEYMITRIDGKLTTGTCMNEPTKEATIEAVEVEVINALQNPDKRYWE